MYASSVPLSDSIKDPEEVTIFHAKMLAAKRCIDKMFRCLTPYASSCAGLSLFEMYREMYFLNPTMFVITWVSHVSDHDPEPHISVKVCISKDIVHCLHIHTVDYGVYYKVRNITQKRYNKAHDHFTTEVICNFDLTFENKLLEK